MKIKYVLRTTIEIDLKYFKKNNQNCNKPKKAKSL